MNILTDSEIFTAEDIEKAEARYEAVYVCETCVKGRDGKWANLPVAVFYQPDETKVPEGGSPWFGLFFYRDLPDLSAPVDFAITNAVSALKPFRGIVADNGDVIYSHYRHDYRVSPDASVWIDGGRDYVRSGDNGRIVALAIREDKLIVVEDNDG